MVKKVNQTDNKALTLFNLDMCSNKSESTTRRHKVCRPKKRNRVRLTDSRAEVVGTPDLYRMLLRKMLDLLDYTYMLLNKFNKGQKLYVGLGCSIASLTNESLVLIHTVCGYNPKIDRESILRQLTARLKSLENLVDASYRQRYISSKNRESWLRKIVEIDNIVIGLAMWLQKKSAKK